MNLLTLLGSRPRPKWATRLAEWLPTFFCLGPAIWIWAVFSPGLLSIDSVHQYSQAVCRAYNDWHPLILALAVRTVLSLGGDMWTITLIQAIAGVLGLRAFISAALHFATEDALPCPRREWLATLITCLFLLPLTPLMFLLVTFWKDTWTTILFLWVGSLAIRLFQRADRLSPVAFIARATCLAGVMGLSGLPRHNTLVTLPAMGLLLVAILRRRRVRFAWLAVLVPLISAFCGNDLLFRAAWPTRKHVENALKRLDLVGLCALEPSLRERLPYTSSHILATDFRERYRFGDISCLAPLVDQEWRRKHRDPELAREYATAVRAFPFALARLKWRAFVPLLGISETRDWFWPSVESNPYGLHPNPTFRPVRRPLIDAGLRVASHPLLRWLSAVHLVWMIVGLAWLARSSLAVIRAPSARSGFLAALPLIPVSYYLSYLPAVASPDFRYMYPATLFVQAMAACWLAALLRRGTLSRLPMLARSAPVQPAEPAV